MSKEVNHELKGSPLGQKSTSVTNYDANLLFPIARSSNREGLKIEGKLPFKGYDIWNAYEISWLDPTGKPHVAVGELWIPCETPFLVESKALKLYLNSFNLTKFKSVEEVRKTIQTDLSKLLQGEVQVKLHLPQDPFLVKTAQFEAECLDDLTIETDVYDLNPEFLTASGEDVEEECYSHLLRTNCPVTAQPDWASVMIAYKGPKINKVGLLKYVISFRNHQDFHEHCIETFFIDILRRCHPKKLAVYGRGTRRGGIDINSFRANYDLSPQNIRVFRQ